MFPSNGRSFGLGSSPMKTRRPRLTMPISARHIPLGVALIAAAVCAFSASPARAASICGDGTYAYAGFDGGTGTRGVSATISQAGPLGVRDGHVAGWVGVVDPRTDAAWLQVGLSALPNDTTSEIYYEVAFPGHAPVYHQVRTGVAVGEPHRFAVLELQGRSNWWRVWVDGKPATAPLHLQGSHGRWSAQVLGESWAGTASGACNTYRYAFDGVSLLAANVRMPAQHDPNYAVVRRSPTSFVATSL
jgi:hypothetical protein